MFPNTLYLHRFEKPIPTRQRPISFTFPFSYEPHALSKAAAEQTQAYLNQQSDFVHFFGLKEDEQEKAIGKMFGVLVVEDQQGDLGFLAAVSGKLAGVNQHRYFVPPIFDMLHPGGFFLEEEERINAINRHLEQLQASEELQVMQTALLNKKETVGDQLAAARARHKQNKQQRKTIRDHQKDRLSSYEYEQLLDDLIKQSYRDQHEYAVLKQAGVDSIATVEAPLNKLLLEIDRLKQERKSRSAQLQNKLFEQYVFLNAAGQSKTLLDIFEAARQELPPAGAGECAAPKLLQHAFIHGLKPICMAEFWWGISPRSEVRKHKYFYPACRGKCEPILAHMLQGLQVDPNPMLINTAQGKELPIVYQDEAIVVINKPTEFLTVPGIHITDSVQTRIQTLFPDLDSPWIVHRLDMSTSGLLVLAKTKSAHQFLQQQFADQTVEKRYTALLDGDISSERGEINLPLRVDLNDRPRQIVCNQYGRVARTLYEVVNRDGHYTRVHFFPVTGRTHQLRVHAAHVLGLNTPIVGDDLYGRRTNRLHLHAGKIGFIHPLTRQWIEFEIADPF
ncbi:MAG: pseudouridine synthase [Sphingobacterium sp.]